MQVLGGVQLFIQFYKVVKQKMKLSDGMSAKKDNQQNQQMQLAPNEIIKQLLDKN